MKIFSVTRIAAVACVAALGSCFSTAQAETVNLGTLEPGVEYSWPKFSTVIGQYTPSKSGAVKFLYRTSPAVLYPTSDHTPGTELFGAFSYADNGQLKTYELEAGTTYYLYDAYSFDANTLTIYEGASELEVLNTSPDVLNPESGNYYGGKMSASATYEMLVNFNFPVTIGNVFLVAPDNSRAAVTAKSNGSSVGCDIAPAMMELYHDGKIQEGDEVILRLFQVTDASDSENKYNGNGRCEIKFNVAAKPLELVEVEGAVRGSVENEFFSYYLPGDEKGKIKFIFDAPLSEERLGTASIEYGNSDNIEVGIYHETVTAVHDGATATFDFTDVRRRPIDMLPASDSSTQPESIYISFGNLSSPDGQRAYTGSKSNPTGYPMSFLLQTLQYTVVGDFTPARGTPLTFGAPMEVWVMNGDKIMYDTFRFEYTENGEAAYYDMPREEITEEADPYSDGAMLYTFTVPTLNCDPETPVIVRMTGLICADGLDHSNDVYGDYSRAESGVESIAAALNGTFDVYDVAGVRVLRNADRNSLKGLAKGLYIVNGKKIAIR